MLKIQKIFISIGCILLLISLALFGARQYSVWHLFKTSHDFLPPVAQVIDPELKSFKFIVIGDTGDNAATLVRLLKDAETENPNFIIYVGDLVRRAGDKYFNYMTHVIESAVGDIPVYFTPGNHDIIVSKSRDIVEPSHYIGRLGQTNYWFGYGDTLFISLDSANETIDNSQWDFYSWTMKNVRPSFRRAIVFTHIPPANASGYSKRRQTDDSANKMAKMVKKYTPSAIFAGHVHYWSEMNFNGAPLYTSPASGQRPSGDFKEMGYLVATVDSNGINVRPKYIEKLSTKTQSSNVRRLIRAVNGDISSIVLLVMMMMAALFILSGLTCGKKTTN